MTVHVDDQGVHLAGGGSISWTELVGVDIQTTDQGPFVDDVRWLLRSNHGRVLRVGSESPGMDVLLARLQQLPGFDNETVIRAATSTDNAVFECWRRRTVTLRDERDGADTRWLGAYLDAGGALHVDGHDIGPGTAMISSDGEYEWFKTVAASDLPRLVEALGGQPGDDVLDLLEASWTGTRSYDFERVLRTSGIPVNLSNWTG